MKFFGGCIRLLSHELPQAFQIDLHHPQAAHGLGSDAPGFSATLFDPPRPGTADLEEFGDLPGLHPAVIGCENSVTQILRVRCTHPWLLENAREPAAFR